MVGLGGGNLFGHVLKKIVPLSVKSSPRIKVCVSLGVEIIRAL